MKKRLYISILITTVICISTIIYSGTDALINTAPLWPPFIAIILALITRDVIISLFTGVWAGAVIALKPSGVADLIKSLAIGFFNALDTYILKSVADSDHVSIILFTLLIGGTVGVISSSGGLEGFVSVIAKKVSSRIKAQISAWLLGMAVFFDDYTNCLIVGNMMRPIFDRFRISREKLSFIVDTTAAPVSSLFLVSTWIGFEIGLISEAMKALNIPMDAYAIFLSSIPYRFYVIIVLLFIPLLIFMKREFGAMFQAEERAVTKNQPLRPGSKPLGETDISLKAKPQQRSAILAILPILILIFAVIVSLIGTGINNLNGKEKTISNILGSANSYKALLWASLASSLAAISAVIFSKALTFKDAIDSWISGIKSMLMAVIVLSLAWAIGGITKELKTAEYVIAILSSHVSSWFLPAAIFVSAALISFATGTSWGTMAILFPIAIPLAHKISLASGFPAGDVSLIYITSGAVLSGSVFGDHCSPISDTTILSSIGSCVDHIDHVNTQLYYAVFVAIICLLFGYIPAGFGINPWILNAVSLFAIFLIMLKIGKKIQEGNNV
ncbi:MAG: Na+/H+ antiporter NhaC family protein [Elusimicrobia bacterium]|nr:Na+/H+ antiporter NhaC family protein [Elusimicrobiota bacterium]